MAGLADSARTKVALRDTFGHDVAIAVTQHVRRGSRPCARPWCVLALVLVTASCTSAVMEPSPRSQMPISPTRPQDGEATYAALLERYVDARGRIAFAAWASSPADVARLDAYTEQLLRADGERSLAHWLNLYNAVAVRAILRHWPIASIDDIASDETAFRGHGRGLFYDLRVDVAGTPMSLLDIETKVIRMRFSDPRAHLAIHCGARSCAMMPAEPFTEASLDRRLDQATRAFVNQRDNVAVDHETRTLTLSPILDWYQSDFVALVRRRTTHPAPSIIDMLMVFADAHLRAALRQARDERYRIAFTPYDWRIDEIGAQVDAAARDEPRDLRQPMVDVALRSLDGRIWRPSDARGKVILLDFWATWCRPCLWAFPRFAEWQLADEQRGLLVVAVAQDERQEPVDAFVRANRTAISVVMDPDHRALEAPFSVTTLPTALLIDREGIVRQRHVGYSRDALNRLEANIAALLDEPFP